MRRLLAAAGLVAMACGSGSESRREAPGAIAETPPGVGVPPGAASIQVAHDTELGTYLTDAHGRALYMFTNDAPATSRCLDACALSWPPFVTDETPQAGDASLHPNLIAGIERAEGRQVTYRGQPLYYFARDAVPGETSGHDVNAYGGEWYLVAPTGAPVGPPR